jgi:hypothetical protein
VVGWWLTRQTAVAEAVPPAAGGVLLVVGHDGGHPPDGELHLHHSRSGVSCLLDGIGEGDWSVGKEEGVTQRRT